MKAAGSLNSMSKDSGVACLTTSMEAHGAGAEWAGRKVEGGEVREGMEPTV